MSNAPKCKSPTGQCFARSLGYCTILTCELVTNKCSFKSPADWRRAERYTRIIPRRRTTKRF